MFGEFSIGEFYMYIFLERHEVGKSVRFGG